MRLVLAAFVLFALPALAEDPKIRPGAGSIKKRGDAVQRVEARGLTEQKGRPVEQAASAPELPGKDQGLIGLPAEAGKKGETQGLIIQNGKPGEPAAPKAAPRPAAKR